MKKIYNLFYNLGSKIILMGVILFILTESRIFALDIDPIFIKSVVPREVNLIEKDFLLHNIIFYEIIILVIISVLTLLFYWIISSLKKNK